MLRTNKKDKSSQQNETDLRPPLVCRSGHVMTTRNYAHKLTGGTIQILRREAVQTALSSDWTVQSIKKYPNTKQQIVDTEYLLKREKMVGKTGIPFHDAVYALAEFEATQPNLGFAIIDDEDNIINEGHYFKNIARMEGIAFDAKGYPHYTLHGHICTDGEFDPAEQGRVYEAMKKPKPSYPVKSLRYAFYGERASDNVDRLVEYRLEIAEWKKLKSHVDDVIESIEFIYANALAGNDTTPGRYNESMTVLVSTYEARNQKTADDDLGTFINSVKIGANMVMAMATRDDKDPERVKFFQSKMNRMEELAKQGKLDDEAIGRLRNGVMTGSVRDVEKELSKFSKTLDTTIDTLKEQAKQEVERLSLGFPRVIL